METQLTELTGKLRAALGDRVVSVILYGSAARQEHHAKFSDLNILCVLREVSPRELADSEPVARWWRELGNPAPLLLTPEEVKTSTDCFPIEFHDMLESRRLLYGDDVIAGLQVDRKYYRAQVEYQLRSHLLRLRQKAAGVLSDRGALMKLMLDSVSTFLVLARHAALLSGVESGGRKRDTAAALPKIDVEAKPFDTLLDIREAKEKAAGADATLLFSQYLKQIEALVRHVDRVAE
jgi:predicted nucleotidyltransferase